MIGAIINQQSSKVPATQHSGLIPVYAVFITVAVSVYHLMAESEFSSLLTLSGIFQCLAFCLLGVHALSTGSVQGISAKSLQLQAIAVACRLSTTLWLQGYLPNDKTGDFLYQGIDILSLTVVLWLLHRVHKVRRNTIECDDDTLPVAPFAAALMVLATFFRSDLDDKPIFDTLWMGGLFVGALAMIPQLWLMTRNSANVPAVMSHFVAAMAASCLLSGKYMWHAHDEITSDAIKHFNHAGDAILVSHAVHLMLLGMLLGGLATQGLRSPRSDRELELSESRYMLQV